MAPEVSRLGFLGISGRKGVLGITCGLWPGTPLGTNGTFQGGAGENSLHWLLFLLCSLGLPQTHSSLPASASQILG